MTISHQTALDIACAYREIETAEELLKGLKEAKSRFETPDIRDVFGRPHGGLQLGVPSGNNSQRLFNLPWSIAIPVIELHIATQRAAIETLCQQARLELDHFPVATTEG